jgi:hypothetical protein
VAGALDVTSPLVLTWCSNGTDPPSSPADSRRATAGQLKILACLPEGRPSVRLSLKGGHSVGLPQGLP